MNTILFPTFTTPRTPKEYRHAKEPASPLAKYGRPLPLELPSLRSWKDTCRVRAALFSLSFGFGCVWLMFNHLNSPLLRLPLEVQGSPGNTNIPLAEQAGTPPPSGT